jgi:hypothetical protein
MKFWGIKKPFYVYVVKYAVLLNLYTRKHSTYKIVNGYMKLSTTRQLTFVQIVYESRAFTACM